jgi:hypothetical protein
VRLLVVDARLALLPCPVPAVKAGQTDAWEEQTHASTLSECRLAATRRMNVSCHEIIWAELVLQVVEQRRCGISAFHHEQQLYSAYLHTHGNLVSEVCLPSFYCHVGEDPFA